MPASIVFTNEQPLAAHLRRRWRKKSGAASAIFAQAAQDSICEMVRD